MLVLTSQGLYCPAGNFHIDPTGAVENAVITHAHADHARRGAKRYHCTISGLGVLKARVGKNITAHPHAYGEKFRMGAVEVSFHPAGHILGSAQVRIQNGREVWVASGDYKREIDPTCEPFEVVECDTFVTEATFGTPAYSWAKSNDSGAEIFSWWMRNAERGINSVLFAYSLGKTQRVLGLLAEQAKRPVHCAASAAELIACYREQGVKLAPTRCLSEVKMSERLVGELILAPQSFLQTPQAAVLGDHYETAFASGWMARGTRGYDRGFVISDHADWDDLVRTVRDTRARRVYVQHRGRGALVRHLRAMGLQAFPESDLAPADPAQLTLF